MLLGTNVVSTLLSVPLALHYLSKAEFGLWALTSQLAAFLSQIDLGMNSSIARILIDHKDQKSSGLYGGTIKTGVLVGMVQGMIVLGGGLALLFFLGGWLRVPKELSEPFFWLMAGQIFVAAISFVSRTFGQLLYAWQRLEIQNYAQIIKLIAWLIALWWGFIAGLGVYSFIGGVFAGWLCEASICAVACWKLDLWPHKEEWGNVSLKQFRELFHYATDLFLIALGTQIILSSQTILITRMLGMEAVAVWSVMTKAYLFISQMIFRVVNTTMPALAEMQVRLENTRLWERYRGIFNTVTVASGLFAILFAACNGPFVTIWTNGRFSWPFLNDVLLGIWLMLLAQVCCHNSLIMCLKQVRELKYSYLVEGMVFIVSAILVLPQWGITGMLACSIVCTCLFTLGNGVWRVASLSRTNHQPALWKWQQPLLRLLAVLVPCWLIMRHLVRDLPEIIQLPVQGVCLGFIGVLAAVAFALPANLSNEIAGKLPRPFHRMLNPILRLNRN